MPYLAVDLDAKKKMVKAAKAIGVEPGVIAWGLLELWEYAWERRSPIVGEMVVHGCFGPSESIRAALVAFEFLEPVDGGYRVRGADRYLRIAAAQSAAGKAAVGNLKKGPARVSRGGAGEEPETEPGGSRESSPALSPSTEHRAPNEIPKDMSDSPTSELTKQTREVFEHWQEVMDKQRSKLDANRRGKVEARLNAGFSVADLKLAVDGCKLTPYNMGQNENGRPYNDLELICRDASHVERFMANATSPPTPIRAARGRASEADKDWTDYEPKAAEF